MIDNREEVCEDNPDDCRDEEFLIREVSRILYRDYGQYITKNLTYTFMDSWSQKDRNKRDPYQQQKWKHHTDVLYNFASKRPGLKLRTLEHVLRENRGIRAEIQGK